MVVREFVVFGGFRPLLALGRIVAEIFVDLLQHLIVASALFDKL